jgi:outer membrane protein
MKTKTMIGSLGSALGLLACSGSAMAQSNTVRVGLYDVFYRVRADDISGPFVPPGLNLNVNDVQTVYLAYLRRLNPHFELELTAGIPPKTETVGKGPATVGSVPYNGQVIGTVKWFAPSVLVHYKFGDESAPLRPYVGVGMNYTRFYDRVSTPAGNAANGGPTTLSLTNSVGPVATFGLYYRVYDTWSVVASYTISSVSSTLTANTSGVERHTDIKFSPSVFVFALGYSF